VEELKHRRLERTICVACGGTGKVPRRPSVPWYPGQEVDGDLLGEDEDCPVCCGLGYFEEGER
jgi:hypothetical protein